MGHICFPFIIYQFGGKMLVLSKLCSPIKKNQIPIIIAATEIIIVITISFLLLNFDKVDLVSLSEMGTHYIRGKNSF